MRYFYSSFRSPPTCHCFWLLPYFPISERHKPSALLATRLCTGKLAPGRPDGFKETSTILQSDSGSKLTFRLPASRISSLWPSRREGHLCASPFLVRRGQSWATLGLLAYRSASLAGQWRSPGTRHIKVRIMHISKTTCMPCQRAKQICHCCIPKYHFQFRFYHPLSSFYHSHPFYHSPSRFTTW